MKGTNFKRTGSEDGVKNQERTTVRRTEAVLEMKIVGGKNYILFKSALRR